MRLKRQSISVTSGSVLICDPQIVGDCESGHAAVFRLWEGNGEFYVYTDGHVYFVDVDPRIFRADMRPTLSRLPGCVGVHTLHLGVYDLSDSRKLAAHDALADGQAIAINNLTHREYYAWFEEKGTAKDIFRGVIGFGSKPVMLLNGDHGSRLQEIEDQIALAYRLKGDAKQTAIQDISQSLCELHLDGCKDKRLKMMADSIKLTLPRRPPKRH